MSSELTTCLICVEILKNYEFILLKSGLLGDRSGVCEICGKGNVNLTKKEGTYYWKCGARACKKKSLRKGSFLRSSIKPVSSVKAVNCPLDLSDDDDFQ